MDEKRAGMNLSNLNSSGNSQGCLKNICGCIRSANDRIVRDADYLTI